VPLGASISARLAVRRHRFGRARLVHQEKPELVNRLVVDFLRR
jgi:hypothetical protein